MFRRYLCPKLQSNISTMERSLKTRNNFKYVRTSSLYLKQTIFQSFGGKHLWLISTSSLLFRCRGKWLSQARDQGKVSTTKETENRGSIKQCIIILIKRLSVYILLFSYDALFNNIIENWVVLLFLFVSQVSLPEVTIKYFNHGKKSKNSKQL